MFKVITLISFSYVIKVILGLGLSWEKGSMCLALKKKNEINEISYLMSALKYI